MIEKIIVKRKSYVSKSGEEKTDVQFYVLLSNGNKVRISPYFCTIKGKEWNTFKDLLLIAESESNDEK